MSGRGEGCQKVPRKCHTYLNGFYWLLRQTHDVFSLFKFTILYRNVLYTYFCPGGDFVLDNCTHEEAVNALKRCKDKVVLVVSKAENPFPSSPTIGQVSTTLLYQNHRLNKIKILLNHYFFLN